MTLHSTCAQLNCRVVFLAVALLTGGLKATSAPARRTEPLPAAGVIYVATNGNDSWSGSSPSRNSNRTDGPLLTLDRAVSTLRGRQPRRAGTTNTIILRAGKYFFKETLVLQPSDSFVTFAAYPGEAPVLSGGRRIEGWSEVEINGKKLWAAAVPALAGKKWIFRELWMNGKRAIRARHPNHGYLSIAELTDPSTEWTKGQTRFRFKSGDLKAWPSAHDAELVVMSRWVESRLPIAAIDEETRTVRFSKRSVFELAVGDPYYVEGALELLDTPGEWYLNPESAMVYYSPLPGETLGKLEAIAPVLSQLIRMEGQPEKDQFIDGLIFRGLTFSHTEWYFPEGFQNAKDKPTVSPEPQAETGGFAQAAIGVPGAIWAQGLRGTVFENCVLEHIGDYALELARGCQSNVVRNCEIADLGAGGVRIGETSIREKLAELARANEIIDCHIHDGGKMFHSAIGVWIGQSPDNKLVRNLIHDFYYTGISIGWTWGYGPALATNNLVLDNHIHHIGVKSDGDGPILSDMGGIYTLGKQPGTRIINNLWHDIAGIRYGGWGIYFDEGSSGILAESNLVYRTTHGGFHQHYGETNIVRNNIFAFGRDQQVQRSRPETHPSFQFQTNIVYFDSGNLLGGDWSGDQYQIDFNIYFDARPDAASNPFRLGPASLEKWRERNHDKNSIVGNPLFVAPAKNDFRLQPESPALKLGFQPLDMSRVGPLKAPRS